MAVRAYASVEERAALAIELARRNVAEGNGGPFGAAVFDHETGRLLSVGVNLVVSARCSVAHAEIVALGLAQQALQTHDLGAEGMPVCELVSSTEPCAMCLGAIPWSGVRRLVCAAREEDARRMALTRGTSRPIGRRPWSGAALRCCAMSAGRKPSPFWRPMSARAASIYNGGRPETA